MKKTLKGANHLLHNSPTLREDAPQSLMEGQTWGKNGTWCIFTHPVELPMG